MARTPYRWLSALLIVFWIATPASAQPIGALSWQLQPFCNVLTLTVNQVGNTFTLDGFDDRCGQGVRAPASGLAVMNPDGTIGLGVTLVIPNGDGPMQIDATIENTATLSGSWRDSVGYRGSLAYGGSTGGTPRPVRPFDVTLAGTELTPRILGIAHTGTETAPSATAFESVLFNVGAGGHTGTTFTQARAAILFRATQTWTPAGQGAQIEFHMTPDDYTSMRQRMVLHETGLGIGVPKPSSTLDVGGDIRIGLGATGCVRDRDATIVAGACSSDVRLKRDISSFPTLLDDVARLRPVHFYWRSDQFPERAFGERQSFGLIAQEVEEVLPELVAIDEHGYRAVNYSKLPLLAIQAIKELKEKNDTLERRLAALEATLKYERE